MKLAQYAHEINGLGEKLDEFRRAQQSLKFCLEVWRDYTVGGRAANEHMDEGRALAQLLQSINEVIRL